MVLLLGSLSLAAQKKNFSVEGTIPLPDGYTVGITCQTDTSYSVQIADGVIKDGHFTLSGTIDRPLHGTLMTNNLDLVSRNHWPDDSIRWTYSDVFLSPGKLYAVADMSDKESPVKIVGTQVQTDFNALRQLPLDEPERSWAFIDGHPHSYISLWLAESMLKRGYNLTAEQVEHLASTITSVPGAEADMARFRTAIESARLTTRGADIVDLNLFDTHGREVSLTRVIPKGKYVLLDFWASWCGICLYSMPEVAQIAADYSHSFTVVGVSIDRKDEAWRKALKKHPQKWAQYRTTEQGYKDMFSKYRVGDGVPYYLLLSPEGKVLFSPSHPSEVREFLSKIEDKPTK